MSLGFNSHPLLLVAGLLAAGVLTFWVYRRTTPRLSPPVKSLLAGLRFVALAIVILLLFNPILTRSSDRQHPPVLALLVDNSASQTLADAESLRERLKQLPLRDVAGDVLVFGFDGQTRLFGSGLTSLDSLSFDGGRTNISQAIEHLQRAQADRNIRSILLISDGLFNSGRNPIYAAEESVIPIHTAVSGDTSRFQDVRIQDVLTNEIAYAGTELPVRVRILSDGYEDEQVTVSLQAGSRVLARETMRLRGDGTEQSVDLAITPSEPGLMQMTANVTRLDGEATHRNNTRTLSVRVIESRRTIAIIAGAPDPDVGALRQALAADPSLDVRTLTQRDPDSFLEGTIADVSEDADLVILAGFPHARSSQQLLDGSRRLLAESGVPVLILAGRNVHAGGLRALGDAVLPALPSSDVTATHEAQVALSPAGRSHPVMGGHAQGETAWNSLPPSTYPDAGWRTSPDASILATVRSRGVDLGDPLIVIRNRTGRRSAAVLAYDLWRWRTLPPSLDAADGLFDRFIENMVQWLTSPEDDRLVRVQPVQATFDGGEPVRFTGEVYDERLQPVSGADVQVTIEAEDGSAYPLVMRSEGNGRYRLEAGELPEGSYRFTAEATAGETPLGSDRGTFSVGALELEYQETRADAALMNQIATRTGGVSTDLDGLENALAQITSSPEYAPATERVVQESSLRQTFLLLALALILLAAEWILRKRHGMV